MSVENWSTSANPVTATPRVFVWVCAFMRACVCVCARRVGGRAGGWYQVDGYVIEWARRGAAHNRAHEAEVVGVGCSQVAGNSAGCGGRVLGDEGGGAEVEAALQHRCEACVRESVAGESEAEMLWEGGQPVGVSLGVAKETMAAGCVSDEGRKSVEGGKDCGRCREVCGPCDDDDGLKEKEEGQEEEEGELEVLSSADLRQGDWQVVAWGPTGRWFGAPPADWPQMLV